ncbi:hypothetical protein San01_72410 [Streptomyces angustmyceticus]|uniref:Uncharacterized protein n=1 Tax=Streptomyces angustmyceticus TaxID=285578 RepID=A0A5J4LKX1_9ACTN|nr:hypothetical protein San01_72410 [Streptomyces angustmyceticus]
MLLNCPRASRRYAAESFALVVRDLVRRNKVAPHATDLPEGPSDTRKAWQLEATCLTCLSPLWD